jgi:hypothetical protein
VGEVDVLERVVGQPHLAPSVRRLGRCQSVGGAVRVGRALPREARRLRAPHRRVAGRGQHAASAAAKPSASPTGAYATAVPPTSRSTGRSLATTGVPAASASSTVSPKPSSREGSTSADAPATTRRRSSSATKPGVTAPDTSTCSPQPGGPTSTRGGASGSSRWAAQDLRRSCAAHRLLPDAPPLVLVGPPGWGEQVDVSGAVTPGFVADDDLRRVVAGAAALVLPSRDEGFGLTCSRPWPRHAGRGERPAGPARGRRDGGDVRAGRRRRGLRGGALAGAGLARRSGGAARAGGGFTWSRSAEGHRAAYALASSS